MSFGSTGVKGNGRGRAIELPDGAEADVSPEGRARVRYNDDTGQIEASLDGSVYVPLGGGGALSLNNVAWVDARNGNNGTAQIGSISDTFATVQAALDAQLLLTGNNFAAVVVLAGTYPEDVLIPDVPADTLVSIQGLSSNTTIIRSVDIVTPTVGGVELRVTLSDLTLGQRSGGGQTVNPLRINASNGDAFISLNRVDALSSTAALDAISMNNSGATGTVVVEATNGTATTTAGPSSALFIETGRFLGFQFDMEGVSASTVNIAGNNVVSLANTALFQSSAPGIPIISHVGSSGSVVLFNVGLTLSDLFNNIFFAAQPGVQFTSISSTVFTPFFIGAVQMGGGPVAYNFLGTITGFPVVILGAGSLVYFQGALDVGFNSVSTVLQGFADNVQSTTVFLLSGVNEVANRVVGPTTLTPLDNVYTYTIDTSQPVTINLPAISSLPRGKSWKFVDVTNGGSNVLINAAAGDTVDGAVSVTLFSGLNSMLEITSERNVLNWAITNRF